LIGGLTDTKAGQELEKSLKSTAEYVPDGFYHVPPRFREWRPDLRANTF
jgi:hypothetical protein